MKKLLVLILALILAVSLCACNKEQPLTNENQQSQNGDIHQTPNNNLLLVPDDFSFALTWNVFGISSYDSHTGKLVKTTDATNPEDYVTYYQLTDAEMKYIYNLIISLDVYSYPDVYDPQNGESEPDATLILTVRVDDEEKTIKAEHISLFFVSEDEKGQLFLDTCNAISDLLEATDEWKALPNYEILYD